MTRLALFESHHPQREERRSGTMAQWYSGTYGMTRWPGHSDINTKQDDHSWNDCPAGREFMTEIAAALMPNVIL